MQSGIILKKSPAAGRLGKISNPRPCEHILLARELPDTKLKKDGTQLSPLWKWKNAVCAKYGYGLPPTTRSVLHVLSMYMNEEGGNCFPSIKRLALESGLSVAAVKKHLKFAAAAGWIQRTAGQGHASGWRTYEYQATVPDYIVEKPCYPQQRRRAA